jgi:hypothetical protein
MYGDLRRLLASLDFRFAHVTSTAPKDFEGFRAGADVRTPLELVRHLRNLVEFVHEQFDRSESDDNSEGTFEEECRRFRSAICRLDAFLASSPPFRPTRPGLDYAGLLQGPVSDALTHVGQLAMLRRLAGSPVAPIRYWRVEMPLPGAKVDGF